LRVVSRFSFFFKIKNKKKPNVPISALFAVRVSLRHWRIAPCAQQNDYSALSRF